MITEEMISTKVLEIDHGPTTGRERGPKTETEEEIQEREEETREREIERGRGREDERGRGETGPVTDVVVDLETETTGDPRMIAEEADPKNGNPRSITEDHLQVTSCEYSCDEISIIVLYLTLTDEYYFRMALLLARKLHNIIRLSNPVEVQQLSKFSSAVVFNFKSTGQTFKKVDDEEEKSRPVKFSTSPGYNLNPHVGVMRADKDDTPWFQGPVIAFSLACFLIYFTMLRLENIITSQDPVSQSLTLGKKMILTCN